MNRQWWTVDEIAGGVFGLPSTISGVRDLVDWERWTRPVWKLGRQARPVWRQLDGNSIEFSREFLVSRSLLALMPLIRCPAFERVAQEEWAELKYPLHQEGIWRETPNGQAEYSFERIVFHPAANTAAAKFFSIASPTDMDLIWRFSASAAVRNL